jgi:hypothetical protein
MGVEFKTFKFRVHVRHSAVSDRFCVFPVGNFGLQTDTCLLYTLLLLSAFLLIVAYSFKSQLTIQVLSGSRFQNKNEL